MLTHLSFMWLQHLCMFFRQSALFKSFLAHCDVYNVGTYFKRRNEFLNHILPSPHLKAIIFRLRQHAATVQHLLVKKRNFDQHSAAKQSFYGSQSLVHLFYKLALVLGRIIIHKCQKFSFFQTTRFEVQISWSSSQ